MISDPNSQMPMPMSTRLPLDPTQIQAPMPQSGPPPQAMGAAPLPGAPAGPAPGAAPTPAGGPPFETIVQPDGSILSVVTKGLPPGMKPIVIGVHRAPKIPPALQALTGQAAAA